MSEPEFIEIDVNVPPWSESEKSWHLLTKKDYPRLVDSRALVSEKRM